MGVKLREKQLKNGQISFYLDIYHNRTRWYEFLEIHINKNRPATEDKEKKRMAQEIRTKREHELIVEENGLYDRKKKLACFIVYFEEYVKSKNFNGCYAGALSRLKKFAGKQPVPFAKLSADWMKQLEKDFLSHVSNNTTLRYLNVINGALNEAVRTKILNRNPWHDVPHYQRMRMQDVFRNSFTTKQLQLLANTPAQIDKQIRQAYFFSCFTGLRWSDVNPLRWDEIIIKEVEGETNYYFILNRKKQKVSNTCPFRIMPLIY